MSRHLPFSPKDVIFFVAMKIRIWAALVSLSLAFELAACGRNVSDQQAAAPVRSDPAQSKAETSFEGTILFQSDEDGDNDIYRLTAEGVRKLTDNTWSDEYPRWSPDGTKIAFSANPLGNYDIFVMNADGSNLTAVLDSPADETDPAWLPGGTALAFTRGDALWQIELKTKSISRVFPGFSRAHGLSDFSSNGELTAFTGKRFAGWDVFLGYISEGRWAALTSGGKGCRPRFSRDGTKISFVSSKADGKGDIWVMKADGSEKTRLTSRDDTYDYYPSWSGDGTRIVFSSGTVHSWKEGQWSLFLVDAATKKVTPLFSAFQRAVFPDWH